MEVKGTAIHSLLHAIENVFGSGGLARVRAALPETIRARLEPMVLASASYPVAVSAALHEAIRAELGGGRLTANRRVGEQAARIDFSGVYRVFIRLADYETLLRGLDRAWRRYNSQGTVRWDSISSGFAAGEISAVSGYTEAMWHAVAGRLEAILTVGGAKAASVTVEDFSESHAQLTVRWTR